MAYKRPAPSPASSLRRSSSQIRIGGWSCSCFRLFFMLSIALFVYLNVVHLNSRYLEEIYYQGEQAVSFALGSGRNYKDAIYEQMMEQPTSQHQLPPIYWINLDVSVARRHAMQDMFRSLGILVENTHRIPAMDVNMTLDLWNRQELIFHRNVSLEEKDGRPSNKKHIENIYEYQEAACLMSHLKAIRRAFLDGHSQVLILEDDALLSHNFLKQWRPYVDRAPLHWKILQFATNNPNVVKQGVNLIDHFISWQPYHWSTRAYIINRVGMQTLMDKAHSLSPTTGSDIWRFEQDPMVVADEVLYYVIGEAYTSTRLWVDSLSFGSTIQSKNAHSNLSSLIGDASEYSIMSYTEDKRPESLLILMNVRARDVEELAKEMQWIRQDNHAVSRLHETCEWEINLVLTDQALMEAFREATHDFPSNIHFHAHVSSDPFNKFAYIRTLVDEMLEYDLVLFKDNDQRITGFPWRTFMQQKENAVIAGPLRQNTEEALLYRHSYPKRQWFQFHAAEAWTEDWNTKWSSQLFAQVVPTDVPLLEMYFVLFDAKFANYFFDMILTPDFVNQTSAWGPDLVWCSAAREWDPKRPSCFLVPVSSSHEDTRQISKDTSTHKENGFDMVNKFKENPKFENWMKVPEKWSVMIGGHMLWQIERRCRRLLRLRIIFPFQLQKCPQKVYEMLSKYSNEDLEAHVTYQTMSTSAQERLAPWLQQLNQRDGMRAAGIYGSPQNRTRVAELVAAVKNSRANATASAVYGRTSRGGVSLDNNKDPEESSLNSLSAFQTRLAELKQARAERLAEKMGQTGGESAKDDGTAAEEANHDTADAEEEEEQSGEGATEETNDDATAGSDKEAEEQSGEGAAKATNDNMAGTEEEEEEAQEQSAAEETNDDTANIEEDEKAEEPVEGATEETNDDTADAEEEEADEPAEGGTEDTNDHPEEDEEQAADEGATEEVNEDTTDTEEEEE